MTEQPAYMFRVGGHYGKDKIQRVKVIKLTAKMLTYAYLDWHGNPSRNTERLQSGDRASFPTWEEAHGWLMTRAENKLASVHRQLQVAQSELGSIKGMKKPEYES
jgi:hypothetical protein